jgi:hypothetical protein
MHSYGRTRDFTYLVGGNCVRREALLKGVHKLYGILDLSLIRSPSTTKLPYP